MESTFNVASIWVNWAQHHDVEATEKVDSTESVTALPSDRRCRILAYPAYS